MSDAAEVLNPPTGVEGVEDKTSSQPSEPPAQAAVSPETTPTGQVEPAAATSRPSGAENQPSGFYAARKFDKLFQRLDAFEKKFEELKRPAPQQAEPELTDDDFYKLGPKEYYNRLMIKNLAALEDRIPTLFQSHLQSIEKGKLEQEVQAFIDKYAKTPHEERILQIFDEHPYIEELVKSRPKEAEKLIEIILGADVKKKSAPLAPANKSRMAPVTSGSPVGGGSGKSPSLEEVKALKDERIKDA